MKEKLTNNLIKITILLGLLSSGILLYKSCFFSNYNYQVFNNIITPIATILAFIVYYATLTEIKKSNTKNIDFQKIILFKEKINKLKENLEKTPLKLSPIISEKYGLKKEFNLISFYPAYDLIHTEMSKKINNNEINIYDESMFIFSFCLSYKLHFNTIESIINEIQKSNFDRLEKSTLTDILVETLNDYLIIIAIGKEMYSGITYTNSKKESIKVFGYDAPFDSPISNRLTTVFNHMNFDKIYDLMKNNKIIP